MKTIDIDRTAAHILPVTSRDASFMENRKKMPGTLYKVWNSTHKKMVFASSIEELVSSGRKKLLLSDDVAVRLYLQDGTEVDDDDTLRSLEVQTVIYLLQEHDEKPWEQTSQIIPVEEFDFRQRKVKSVKVPCRGEINFAPPGIVSAENYLSSKQFLAEEFKKPLHERNFQAVSNHMDMTFSDRQSYTTNEFS